VDGIEGLRRRAGEGVYTRTLQFESSNEYPFPSAKLPRSQLQTGHKVDIVRDQHIEREQVVDRVWCRFYMAFQFGMGTVPIFRLIEKWANEVQTG